MEVGGSKRQRSNDKTSGENHFELYTNLKNVEYRKLLEDGDDKCCNGRPSCLSDLTEGLSLYQSISKMDVNGFVRCEALFKAAKCHIDISAFLRDIPASASETSALYGQDPDVISNSGIRFGKKSIKLLDSAIAAAYEIVGDGFVQLHNHKEAAGAYEKSLQCCDKNDVRVKLKHLDINTSSVESDDAPLGDGGATHAKKIQDCDDLECPLCMKLFYEPYTTPCQHTFCRGCILRAADYQRASKCPICRQVIHTGGELPINTLLQSILERSFPDDYQSIRPAQNHQGGHLLPLFVMSSILPGEKMSLNIFEPRYRLMIRRVLSGNGRFGMISVSRNGTLNKFATEVKIVDFEPYQDGRYGIEVEGTRRFVASNPVEIDGYRAAEAHYFFDDPCSPEDREGIESTVKYLEDIMRQNIEELTPLGPTFLEKIGRHPGTSNLEDFSFWVASVISIIKTSLPGFKHEMLAQKNSCKRLQLLHQLLSHAMLLVNSE